MCSFTCFLNIFQRKGKLSLALPLHSIINRGEKKILPIKYTPDFVSDSFIIECKGRANESFPLRWKMFKKYVNDNLKHVILYKPQNQKECDEVIELIIKNKIK